MRRSLLQPRHLLLLIVLAALVAFIVITALTDAGTTSLDKRIRSWAVTHQRQPYVYFSGLLHYGGVWWVVAILAAVIAIVLWRHGRRADARYLVLTMLLSFSLNLLLKMTIHRSTPGGFATGGPSLYAFPSGHTMTATAFGTALAVIAWPTRWRWPVLAGAFVFAVVMGASRVYIGAHWSSDVAAGWAMGIVVAVGVHTAMVWAAHGKDKPAKPQKHPIDVVFLDWGGTLMVDDGTQTGPMVTWPRVAAVAGAREALAALAADYRLIVATNADDSTGADVRAALQRVRLDEFIDDVVTSRDVGARKPDPLFYRAALLHAGFAGLPLAPLRAVMVGDAPVNDVAGAKAAGIRAVWFAAKRPAGAAKGKKAGGAGAAQRRPAPPPLAALTPPSPDLRIDQLRELPAALKKLGGPLRGKADAAAGTADATAARADAAEAAAPGTSAATVDAP